MSYAVSTESAFVRNEQNSTVQESTNNPSSVELFSYAFCCAAQGLVWVICLVSIVIGPIALRLGMLENLL